MGRLRRPGLPGGQALSALGTVCEPLWPVLSSRWRGRPRLGEHEDIAACQDWDWIPQSSSLWGLHRGNPGGPVAVTPLFSPAGETEAHSHAKQCFLQPGLLSHPACLAPAHPGVSTRGERDAQRSPRAGEGGRSLLSTSQPQWRPRAVRSRDSGVRVSLAEDSFLCTAAGTTSCTVRSVCGRLADRQVPTVALFSACPLVQCGDTGRCTLLWEGVEMYLL